MRIVASLARAREQNPMPAPAPATRHGHKPLPVPAIRGQGSPAGMPAYPPNDDGLLAEILTADGAAEKADWAGGARVWVWSGDGVPVSWSREAVWEAGGQPGGARHERSNRARAPSIRPPLPPVRAPPPSYGPLQSPDRAPSWPDRASRPRTDLRRHWIDLRHREMKHYGHRIDLRRCRIELRGEVGQAAAGDPNAPKGSWRGEARRGEASGRCEAPQASLASGGGVRRMRGFDGRGATVAGGIGNWDGKP